VQMSSRDLCPFTETPQQVLRKGLRGFSIHGPMELPRFRYLKLRTLKSCWKIGMWSINSAAETYSEHFKFLNCFNVEIGFKST